MSHALGTAFVRGYVAGLREARRLIREVQGAHLRERKSVLDEIERILRDHEEGRRNAYPGAVVVSGAKPRAGTEDGGGEG